MRNLNKTIAALSLFVPTSVYPLGIGEIKLHSALNQSLDAEIALFLSKGESISDIKVRLAPPEKFDEAGVAWSYFLSKIKFEAVTRRDGATIVKLSSNEVLREPFLDFLLEVTWAQGNLYREFTVLVDPPAAYAKPVVPVIQKAQKKVKVNPVELSGADKPVAVKKVVSVTPSSQYGPTNRSDSLWKVAEKTNAYGDVSIEQMMMAIYKANPKAFYKENVNALMAGQVLEIPEKDLVLKLSRRKALAAFKKQNDSWNRRVADKKLAQQSVPEIPNSNKQLELEAPVEAEIKEAVVVVSKNDKSDVEGTDSETKRGVTLPGEEMLSLQAKMEKLEQEVVMMQKMLVLKDAQIAALQNQPKLDTTNNLTKPQQKSAEIKAGPLDEPISKPDLKTAEKPKIKPVKKTATKVVKKPVVKPKPKSKPVVKPEPETGYLAWIISCIGIGILGMLGWFWWSRKKDQELMDTESMFASASEISMPDSILEDTSQSKNDDVAYDVGTVGESSFLSEFTPSDFDAFDTNQDEIDPISEADVYLAYGRYQQAEDLIRQAITDYPERDECKLKLLEIFYANEDKDAFQKYSEQLVNSGKHKDHDFWFKVTEMGAELFPGNSLYTEAAGGKASFDTEDLVENNESVVAENVLIEMPETQDSDNADPVPLKGDEVSSIASEETTEEIESDSSLDFDLSVFGGNVGESHEDTEKSADEDYADLDFDLSVFDLDEPGVTEKPEDVSTNENEVESLDFDLSVSVNEEPANDQTLAEKVDENVNTEEIESIDFDLTVDTIDASDNTVDLSSEVETVESLDDFDFDFSSDITPSEIELPDSVENEQVAEGVESFDEFDFDFDTPVQSPDSKSEVGSESSDVSDLTDMDELETKMDLAKAYIDMGDTGSAKKIAEEVLDKGNVDQKKLAQDIIDQLN